MSNVKQCAFCSNPEVFSQEQSCFYFLQLEHLYFAKDIHGSEKFKKWYINKFICAICSCNIQGCTSFETRFNLPECMEARKAVNSQTSQKLMCYLCLKDGHCLSLVKSKEAIRRIKTYINSVPHKLLLSDSIITCLQCNYALYMWIKFKIFIMNNIPYKLEGLKRKFETYGNITVKKCAIENGLILCSSVIEDNKFMECVPNVILNREKRKNLSYPKVKLFEQDLPESLNSQSYKSFVSGKWIPLNVEELVEALNKSVTNEGIAILKPTLHENDTGMSQEALTNLLSSDKNEGELHSKTDDEITKDNAIKNTHQNKNEEAFINSGVKITTYSQACTETEGDTKEEELASKDCESSKTEVYEELKNGLEIGSEVQINECMSNNGAEQDIISEDNIEISVTPNCEEHTVINTNVSEDSDDKKESTSEGDVNISVNLLITKEMPHEIVEPIKIVDTDALEHQRPES